MESGEPQENETEAEAQALREFNEELNAFQALKRKQEIAEQYRLRLAEVFRLWVSALVGGVLTLSLSRVAAQAGIITGRFAAIVASVSAPLIFSAATLLIGATLYLFRRTLRFWYGVSEIVAGACLAAFTIYHQSADRMLGFAAFMKSPQALTGVIGLASSIYVVVRGLDNIEQGWAARQQRKGAGAS